MSEDMFESTASQYDRISAELEAAAAHARVAASHFRDREAPRGCAHAFSTQGHMRTAQNILDELSMIHATKSRPET